MTLPTPTTLSREQGKMYLTDAELVRWLGVPEKELRRVLPELESKYGFPKKAELFGNRRYRPAVQLWLDRYHGISPQEKVPERKSA